ncbi:hypothetical protein H9Q74_003041 [Fusarium xylarioides]|nr:hypothetical protein H9Q71_003773 [Fusarium xylarioides]KAG5826852.1 hypothetical protein H9Q74_003041 [Fusarium xylarioides]
MRMQAITELARLNDSITTDHIITILVVSPGSQFGLYSRTPKRATITSDFIMAGHGHHSFNGPPKPPVAHVPRIYRFTATALGAGMWFFLMYRAKKDGAVLLGLKHPWDH